MGFLYDIYILPEQRGNGVAKYLVQQSIKFLKSKGFTKVGNHVPPWNKPSIRVNENGFGIVRPGKFNLLCLYQK